MRRESLIGTKASAQRPGAAVVANPSDGIGLPGDSRFGMLLFSSVYHKSSCPYIQWRQKALREKYDNLAKGKCLGCISKFLKLLSVTSDRSLMPITST